MARLGARGEGSELAHAVAPFVELDAESGDDAAGEDANSREPGAKRGLDARAGVRAADMSVVGRRSRCAVRPRSGERRRKAVLARGGPVTGD